MKAVLEPLKDEKKPFFEKVSFHLFLWQKCDLYRALIDRFIAEIVFFADNEEIVRIS